MSRRRWVSVVSSQGSCKRPRVSVLQSGDVIRQAELHCITDSSEVVFTRLDVLAGIHDWENRLRFCQEGFKQLLKSLTPEKTLVVDCSGFSAIGSDQFAESLFSAKKVWPKLVFINCERGFFRSELIKNNEFQDEQRIERCKGSEGLLREFGEATDQPDLEVHVEKSPTTCFRSPRGDEPFTVAQAVKAIETAEQMERDYFTKSISKCVREHSHERLRSTPLLATHYFDANRLLACPKAFLWVASRFAIDTRRIISMFFKVMEESGAYQDNPRLLACTSYGCTLASAVQSLLDNEFNLEVDVVERIGPVQRVVKEYFGRTSTTESKRPWYIYIGDFTVAGTEIRVAEAYAYSKRVKLFAAQVIGSVIPIYSSYDLARVQGVNGNAVQQRYSVIPIADLAPVIDEKQITYSFP